ncbi:MAG TPA: hypothetical protein VKA15_17445 [Isosphaeraceae bacterium]|nr:hypothetical protein [Isosphaeraceae bacterium]
MPVLTDTLADDIKGLTASVNGLRTDFAGFKGSTETQLKIIVGLARWVAAGFAGGVLTVAVGAGGVIWAASALHSKVEQQGVRLDKVDQRLDQVERRFDRVDQQLGQIIQRLDQVVPKTKAN